MVREFTVDEDDLKGLCDTVSPHLDERQRRLFLAAMARCLGRGGIVSMSEAAGVSRSTVQSAVGEVDAGVEVTTRVRAPGGGRPRVEDKDPTLLADLDSLVDPETRGDPECMLRWTTKSTAKLAKALGEMGHQVSPDTVARLLKMTGYSLQAPAKENEGKQNPDRDAQFRHLNGQIMAHVRAGEPVISVDTKKKEVLGNLANKGAEYEPKGNPTRVDVHDFPDPKLGKAVPYGVYDLAADEGFVVVGSDGDTAEFAAASIGRWWDQVGSVAYPDATRLLITCDSGGSNSYRARLWKRELGALAALWADDHGLPFPARHIEVEPDRTPVVLPHLDELAQPPLTSHQVVVDLIGATTTRSGLKVKAERDDGVYPKGIKVTDAELEAVPFHRHKFHPEWNYTVQGKPLRSWRRRNTPM